MCDDDSTFYVYAALDLASNGCCVWPIRKECYWWSGVGWGWEVSLPMKL